VTQLSRLIQSAIDADRAACHPQEWRVALYTGHGRTLARLLEGEKVIATSQSEGFLQDIADAHNSSLAPDAKDTERLDWAIQYPDRFNSINYGDPSEDYEAAQKRVREEIDSAMAAEGKT
jgi:hypothetical protein